jgi:hypothetical protein
MTNIEASVSVAATPEQAFKLVGNFADASWVPGTARTELEGSGIGAVRTVTTADGTRLKERLESYDAAAHRYTYALIEAPMPLKNYLSTVEVTGEGKGSRIRWTASFEAPPELAEGIRGALDGLFETAMDGLRERLG